MPRPARPGPGKRPAAARAPEWAVRARCRAPARRPDEPPLVPLSPPQKNPTRPSRPQVLRVVGELPARPQPHAALPDGKVAVQDDRRVLPAGTGQPQRRPRVMARVADTEREHAIRRQRLIGQQRGPPVDEAIAPAPDSSARGPDWSTACGGLRPMPPRRRPGPSSNPKYFPSSAAADSRDIEGVAPTEPPTCCRRFSPPRRAGRPPRPRARDRSTPGGAPAPAPPRSSRSCGAPRSRPSSGRRRGRRPPRRGYRVAARRSRRPQAARPARDSPPSRAHDINGRGAARIAAPLPLRRGWAMDTGGAPAASSGA